ncbi:hypothetical protein [Actinocatenispora rupis]|uniref:Uncharacterized protein n=1 Tax=Actinocatenispora rupis TaxID=519421 RepID=A0A8J3NDW2_9ACTN|nr:hypothetical protein [Actinocatenispora rupis]GID13355.1 hypothetical protein Aru02nite_42440 [Actinocatenispora rupis]
MDKFGLSLLPAAAEAGLDTITVSRHVPVLRRDVGRHDTTLAVAQCTEPNRFIQGDLVLLLTRCRLVVTRRVRVLDRVRPYLSVGLTEMSDATWQVRERLALIDFTFRADDRAHHLWVRAPYPGQLDRLAGVFHRVFTSTPIPRQRAAG